MKPPAMFDCPSCSKKHYLVYCMTGGPDRSCDEPYISVFYPSPKDSICPRHRYPDDPEKQEIEWEKVLRCAVTSEVVPIEDLFKAKTRAKKQEQAEMVLPEVGFAPGAGEVKEDLPSAGLARCPACKILFDLSANRACPRCGKVPAAKALVEEVKKREAAIERRREQLYDFAIRKREQVFAIFGGLAVLLLVPLGLTQSSVLQVFLLLLILLFLGVGIGLEFVFLQIADVPFYRVKWEEEMQRRKGKTWWELRQRIFARVLHRPVEGTESEMDSLEDAEDAGEDFRWLWGEGPEPGKEEPAETQVAKKTAVSPPPAPLRPAAPDGGAPVASTRATEEPDEEEVPHLDEVLPRLEDTPGSGAEEVEGESIAWPRTPARLGRVKYLGGHPDLGRKAMGTLVVSVDGLSFACRKGHLNLKPGEVRGVGRGTGTWALAWPLAILFAGLLFWVSPSLGDIPALPSNIGGVEDLRTLLDIARKASLGVGVVRVLLVLFLLSGAFFGPHHVLKVRVVPRGREDEGEQVIRFAMPLLASLRLRRALTG